MLLRVVLAKHANSKTRKVRSNAKRPSEEGPHIPVGDALCADEIALLEAAGADVLLLGTAVHEKGDALDVGTEGAVDRAVGVGDGTTGNGVLTADIANFRHNSDLQ
jgi:hypothetical protein